MHPAVSKLAAANHTAHQRPNPATGLWTCHCGLQTAENSSLPLRRLSIRVRSAFTAVPRPRPTSHRAHAPPRTAGLKQLWRQMRRQRQTHPCSTGSMRPSHVVLISHAHACSTGSMHSFHVVLINRTTKFFFLSHLSEKGTATPHAPRAHPRRPPAPRPSNASFLHFFAHHVQIPTKGLTSGPDYSCIFIGSPAIRNPLLAS